MRFLLPMLLLGTTLAAQQGSIQGVVRNPSDGKPVAGVHVRMYDASYPQAAQHAYGATTETAGRFSIATMAPGAYTVELERAGFLQFPFNVRALQKKEITVRAGEQLTAQQFDLYPLVAISGRVVNQAGDAVPGAFVQATTQPLPASPMRLEGTGPFSDQTADERGRFRLFAAPGKYYIMAGGPMGLANMGSAEIRSDGTSELVYARTYYPDAVDPAGAKMVEPTPGKEITGIEIHLSSDGRRRDLTVSGVISGIPAGAQTVVSYAWGETPGKITLGNSARVGADGHFTTENLFPGYVRLVAKSSLGDTELQSEIRDVELRAPGLTDVRLTLAPGGAFHGTVSVSGGTLPGNLRLSLNGTSPGFAPIPMFRDLAPDGVFRFTGITPGKYSIRVDRLPENAYLKSVLLDDAPAADGILDFSAGAKNQTVKITIGLNGAHITGEVRDDNGLAPSNSRVTIFLVPDAGHIGPTRVIMGAEDGHYTWIGVPPGKYRMYAANMISVSDPQTAQATRQTMLAAAAIVNVPEGGEVVQNLKVMVVGAPNGK